MAILDLTRCPICQARNSLARQTIQLESRTHVTYECQVCGTVLAWLGDEMWLEADRWSFQKVGRQARADLLYRSMTVAELRTLAGEKPPPPPATGPAPPKPPPVWIEIPPVAGKPEPETLPVEVPPVVVERETEAEPEPIPVEVPAVAAEAEPALVESPPVAAKPEPETLPVEVPPAAVELETEPEPAPAPESVEVPAVAAEAEPMPVEVATIAAGPEPTRAEPPSIAAVQDVGPQRSKQRRSKQRRSKQRRSKPPRTEARSRSRGSPFLVISVGLVLLCLICSAAAMVIYSLVGSWPPAGALPTNSPAVEAIAATTAAPTDTPLPTDTPAPTDTPSPTLEVGAETTGVVVLQGVTDYLSSTGSHYLVGEVLNRTPDTLRFVEVLATFYDANGLVVGTGSTFTELSFVEQGSTAPFKLTTLNPPDVGRYELQIDSSTTTQPPIRLEILEHSGSMADSGWYHITGEVRNPHDFTVKFPEIVATYYNGAHEVIRVEVAFAEVNPLDPGQTSRFEVVLTDPPADLQHYTLQTEAAQQ